MITDQKTAIFSPDDHEGFLAAVRSAAPIPVTAMSTPSELQYSPGLGSLIPKLGVAVALVVVAFVVLVFAYSPGPPTYTLTSTSLTIHDRFYPVTLKTGDIDLDRTRLINIATDRQWRPVERTNGFANGHYESGWFRVANGQKVRMYRAEGSVLVLLPPNGNAAPVLLQVREPDRFMQEMCQKWKSGCR